MTSTQITGSGFARLADATSPVRVVLVGAGSMGRHWLRVLDESSDVDVVGVVDLDTALAQQAVEQAGLEIRVGADLIDVAQATAAQAVIDVTVPAAHREVNTTALFAGLPVLCEKPIAPTVAEALSLAAAADATGQLLMTSQSRRYYDSLARFRQAIASIGPVGLAVTTFSKGPHFGGFREEMDHPLLVDMAIHAFDAARYALDAEPVSVYCETWNPPGSWYRGDPAASAVFEFDNGARYAYSGTWVGVGIDTSWNGSWRVSGAAGTALWDGETEPIVERSPADEALIVEAHPGDELVGKGEEIAGALAEFVVALRTGRTPSGIVHSNVLSLAMVEAAVISAERGERVAIGRVIEDAYASARAVELRPEVRDALDAWGSAAAGLGIADRG
jgi:predicted dehydrogenase